MALNVDTSFHIHCSFLCEDCQGDIKQWLGFSATEGNGSCLPHCQMEETEALSVKLGKIPLQETW